MIRKISVVAAIAAIGLSGQAMAAQPVKLGSVQGSVLVNQNGRYVPVTNAMTLRAGDRVMATTGAAKLTYADGCTVSVTARSMTTIGEASPCGGSSSVVRVANQGYDNDDDNNAGGYWGGENGDIWIWLGYGLLTAGVVGAALADDEKPTSP